MTIDLGNLASGGDLPPDDRPVDNSGKPRPTLAYAVCRNGNKIPISINFKGFQDVPYGHPFRRTGHPRVRVYRFVIESEWTETLDQVETIVCRGLNHATDLVAEFGGPSNGEDLNAAIREKLKNIGWKHLP